MEAATMTVTELLKRAQFVVDRDGKRTAVVLNIEAWDQLVGWVKEQESAHVAARIAETAPIESLDEIWGEFWPEDESVDEFIDTVRQWRREDSDLHRELA
jgi:hypothetical protein